MDKVCTNVLLDSVTGYLINWIEQCFALDEARKIFLHETP
jgi:hypothetical protein